MCPLYSCGVLRVVCANHKVICCFFDKSWLLEMVVLKLSILSATSPRAAQLIFTMEFVLKAYGNFKQTKVDVSKGKRRNLFQVQFKNFESSKTSVF